jgi:hypothetical protein
VTDIYSGLFWLVIAILVCINSFRLGVGGFSSPDAGFFPFWSGVVLGTFAIIVMVSNIKEESREKLIDAWKGVQWNKAAWMLISLFLYSFLLPTIGYVIATIALMAFLLGVISRSKVYVQLVIALAIVSVSYLVFKILLSVPLPRGPFGF